MEKKYWTEEELIDYFKMLAYRFEVDAHRNDDLFAKGKSEAYATAAMELEYNFK